MKSIYKILAIAFISSISCSPLLAANETPDTLLNINTPSRVIITENADGLKVTAQGFAEGGDFTATSFTPYSPDASVSTARVSGSTKVKEWLSDRTIIGSGSKKGNSGWGASVDGICLGLTNAVGREPHDGLQWSKSFEICWMSCLNVYYSFSRSSISLGLGFDWRNYKSTAGTHCLVANEDKGIEWGSCPEGSTLRFSRLKTFSLQFPLLYEWAIPSSSLTFKAGPIMNFNTYASLKTVYDDSEGIRCEDFTKAISPRRFTVDFFANLSICRTLGLYVRYSPMKVIDAPSTLNFQPLTVGISIGI